MVVIFKKVLKGILLWTIVLVLVFLAIINSEAYSNVFSSKNIEQNESDGNNYMKFMGEKILLSEQAEELNGEWGDLNLTPFIIEPTSNFLTKQTNINEIYDMFKSSGKWIFKDKSLDEIHTIFLEAGLKKSMCEELMANTTVAKDFNGFITTPPDEVLWNLSAEDRAKLYPAIGKNNENIMYSDPVYYNSSNRDEWVYNSNLSEELKEKLKKLIYVNGGISYISDIHLMLPLLKNEGERISLIQLLSRAKAMDVKLEIKEGQDVSKIADYWGKFGRKELIEPMLEQLSNTSHGGEVDISELLPEIPQSRLNTYSGEEEIEADWKDCHWTTINFFNSKTDESYYNVENLLSTINQISEPVEKSILEFGDVISIFNENNDLTHSCTYIADNLVLTKNGSGNLHPFVITYLDKTALLYGNKTVYCSRTVGNTHSVDLLNFD